jgi:hypothetical protein
MALPEHAPPVYDRKKRQITFKVAEPQMHVMGAQQPVLLRAQEELFSRIKGRIEADKLSLEEIERYTFE